MPNEITYQTWVPLFDWSAVTYGLKCKYQNDLCLEEIELHAQNLLTDLCSINA